MEERMKESDVLTLKLTKTDVEKIKSQANDGNYNNSSTTSPYSRYEAVTGHIWKCACKARKLDNQQLTTLRIVVDGRNRINPPLPQGYFGNATFPTMATSRAGELMEKPLSYASSRIREAVDKMTNEYIRSAVDFVKTQHDLNKLRAFHTLGCTQGPFFGNPNLDVTSWISLPLYGADFGWGKEVYMGPAALAHDGKCLISSSPEGDGSLLVILRVQVAHFDSFKNFFYEDI